MSNSPLDRFVALQSRPARSVVALVLAMSLTACTTGTKSSTVSERSEMWLDRFAIDLSKPETQEGRQFLRAACDEAEEWHILRADRDSDTGYFEDWVLLAELCNRALADDDWAGAATKLEELRP